MKISMSINQLFLSMVLAVGMMFLYACGTPDKEGTDKDTEVDTTPKPKLQIPAFQPDSAYYYVAQQVEFGPRVPNTEAHDACRQWLVDQLSRWADDVIEQPFDAKMYTGEVLKSTNIIGIFNPEAKERILLAAHWDTRFVADYDPDPARQNEPILGADDGASGVGVLLEIARLLSENPVGVGVDIIFFDAEDQGSDGGNSPESWCLGAQHWSRNPHEKGYQAEFGILLDMVGSLGARFTLEGTSMHYAPDVMTKVWRLAQSMGFGSYFVNERTNPITDDHYFVNQITGIPMIDIINRPASTETGFGSYWHTHDDTMKNIHPATLKAAGQVTTAVVYNFAMGTFL